jgi:transaldolase
MNAAQKLHQAGQSLWLDNITRDLLNSGTLQRYITEFYLTGLTSNPTIFQQALKNSAAYESSLRKGLDEGKTSESIFFDLAIEDIVRAADLFRPVFDRTSSVDGWVSLEVSPLLAFDSQATVRMAKQLHEQVDRANVFIKIPGTSEGLPAIEEAIYSGVPVNVTLLFSREQYVAAADAWLRGIERRIESGLRPDVTSVASLFISRWDTAVANLAPAHLKNQLGIAIGKQCYAAYCGLLLSTRWLRAMNAGARPQRLLFASTGTKDPGASDVLYVNALAAPFTVNTLPEGTLKAFADHGQVASTLSPDGGDSKDVLDAFRQADVDLEALAQKLQRDGAASFSKSWNDLLSAIDRKVARRPQAASATASASLRLGNEG